MTKLLTVHIHALTTLENILWGIAEVISAEAIVRPLIGGRRALPFDVRESEEGKSSP
ncbi:hypothetical protein [Desulfosporosinus sp. BG]|uniref:hypothetical protein n=1 Tax=Desulfosporosinus sp. BG TaxID=1633135 RepID=UPI000858361F|nr:hypothetical protein [Desulfosporosinus sp. BG]ODA42824.1 hypothetical protein DSBG_0442 [Desulfosporosinus sp. BG]